MARNASATRPDAPSRRFLPLAVAAVGLGMLFGFMWSSRAVGSAVAEWQVFLTRFVSMATFVALALAFRGRRLEPRSLLLVVAVCLLGRGLCDALSDFVLTGESELMALGAVAVTFQGVGVATMQLLYLEVLALAFDVRRGVAAVAVAYLVAEITYFVLLLIPTPAVPVVARLGEVATFAALVWLRVFSPLAAEKPFAEKPFAEKPFGASAANPAASFGAAVPMAPTVPTASAGGAAAPMVSAGSQAAPLLVGGAPLGAVLAFTCCLTLAWGLFAQMTGEGAYAFFDTTSEIVMVAVRLLLVVACVQVGMAVSFGRLSVFLAMVWATGILTVGVLWGTVAPSTSALVVKAGLYALQVFLLALVVRATNRCPEDFCRVAGLAMCALMFAHVSRLAMLVVFSNDPVVGPAAMAVMAIACWLVAAALAVAMAAFLRRGGEGDARCASEAAAPGQFSLPDLGRRGMEFYRRFERFCVEHDLSERERGVLLETLHGYTVDAVADRLGLSRETVKTYLSRIYSRCGVGGRQELLAVLDAD